MVTVRVASAPCGASLGWASSGGILGYIFYYMLGHLVLVTVTGGNLLVQLGPLQVWEQLVHSLVQVGASSRW